LEFGNDQLVIRCVSDLNLALAGTDENKVKILLKVSDALALSYW
jgi:hypothetical protein